MSIGSAAPKSSEFPYAARSGWSRFFCFTRSVSVRVGAIALTRIRSSAHSTAIDRVIDRMPPLAAVYAVRLGRPISAVIDVVFTIDPPPASFIAGIAIRQHRNVPNRSSFSVFQKCS